MVFEGQEITGKSPSEITTLGIARTFQNIRLFSNMTALENVLVGQHSRMKSGLISIVLRSAICAGRKKKPARKAGVFSS